MPTDNVENDGSDIRSAASQIAGLLDENGHYNPNPDQVSRGHPDYDPDTDARNAPDRDDRGRFKKQTASQAAETLDEETVDSEAVEYEDEESDDRQAAADTEEMETVSEGDEAETDDAETKAAPIRTLSELSDALEIPLDELKANLEHTFNAAGEELTVTLAELEKGYQKDADYRRSTQKLADDRRAIEADAQMRAQAYEAQQHITAQSYAAVEQQLVADLNDPRLAQLRETDPAEWQARRTEIGERVAVLQNLRQQAADNYQNFRNQQLSELKERNQKLLKEAIPEFGEQHTQKARKTLESLGYSDLEMAQVFDYRLVQGALELAELREKVARFTEAEEAAKKTVKRVKKEVPKLAKPGKRKSEPSGVRVQRNQRERAQARLRKSGDVKDAAAVIETLI